jgi:cyclohexa-1,5-dienecarbonyl-CoA hydratase
LSERDTVTLETLDDGAIWRVRLATPKANILDMDKVERLDALFRRAANERDLKAVLIEGEGPHFSFGASVEEHLPGRFEEMIPGFHRLFETMFDAEVATLAAVRGQCLGGGLELVTFCNRIFAAPDTKLGQPEIMLGVFAPVASAALADRVGRSRAEDLCLTGRSIDAEEAHRIGLVDAIADDPGEAALDYARTYLSKHSASSLRMAQRAVRGAYRERFLRDLKATETLYLETLMGTGDANEGLKAFMDKRQPEWSNT